MYFLGEVEDNRLVTCTEIDRTRPGLIQEGMNNENRATSYFTFVLKLP